MKRLGSCLMALVLALALLTATAEPLTGEAAQAFDVAMPADEAPQEVFADMADAAVDEVEEFVIGEEELFLGGDTPAGNDGIEEPAWDDLASEDVPQEVLAQPLPLYVGDPGVIVLYRLYDGLANRVPLPEGALTSYHIEAAPGATFEIIDPKKQYESDISAIFVTEDGTVHPQGCDYYENNASDVTVRVHEGEAQRDVSFHVINYSFVYASAVLDQYLATEINSSMTDLEKLIQVTRIAGRDFDYSTGCSDWGNFILYGAGDCWASTDFILEACARLGISATARDARSDPGAGSGHVNVLATLPQGKYICDAGYNGVKPRYWYVRKEDGSKSYSPSGRPATQPDNAAAPNVLSAEFDALKVEVGREASFSVVTDPHASGLYLYDASGKLLSEWSYGAVMDGNTLCWKPKYTFDAEGVYELTFKASADGKRMGASATVSVEALAPKYDVRSVDFGGAPVAMGATLQLTIETGPDAMTVAALDESGKLVYRWLGENENIYCEAFDLLNPGGGVYSKGGRGTYVVNSGGRRVWHVPFAIWGATGKRHLTFCAVTDDNSTLRAEAYLASDSKLAVDLNVVPMYIQSITATENPGLGEPINFEVVTPYCTGQLAMYDESGAELDTWTWSERRPGVGYVCSVAYASRSDQAVWNVRYTPEAAGTRTFTFRCKPTGSIGDAAAVPYGDPASVTVNIADHAHAHVWSGYVAPTCLAPGRTEGDYCAICGAALDGGEILPPVDHTPVPVPAAAVTCTTDGNTEGSYCAVCGTVLVACQIFPATGHTPVAVPGVAPTCTTPGYTEGSTCAVCGAVLQECLPLAATGHVPVLVPAEAPRFQVPGYTEGSYCAVCGAVLQECLPIPALTWQEFALSSTKSNGLLFLAVGEQRLLVPSFAQANGWTVNGFTSKKPTVASIDASGILTANAEGKTKITVTTVEKKKATLNVQVVDPYKPSAVGIAQGKAVTVAVGQPIQLNAILAPETARATLTWTSSKPGVAAVDANGLVTPLGEGKAKITVQTHNRKKAKITVQVVDPFKPAGIAIAQGETVTLHVGEVLQLNAGLTPATAQSALSWTSKKSAVATVDANGLVTALSKGKAKITVTTYNKKKATIKVIVVE